MFQKNIDEWKNYILSAELWQSVLNGTIRIAIIIIGAFIIIRIGKKVIHHIFNKKRSTPLNIEKKRIQTINVLLNSALKYSVYFVAIVMILETLTIKISALIAGAGVAGLAIGFGAQSLVKDVI